jgi:hypothetical protein
MILMRALFVGVTLKLYPLIKSEAMPLSLGLL